MVIASGHRLPWQLQAALLHFTDQSPVPSAAKSRGAGRSRGPDARLGCFCGLPHLPLMAALFPADIPELYSQAHAGCWVVAKPMKSHRAELPAPAEMLSVCLLSSQDTAAGRQGLL